MLWQTGDTNTSGLAIKSHVNLPAHELLSAIAECDAVITHAGIGSIVSVLQAGKRPVVIRGAHSSKSMSMITRR